jgi:hypothetical protein
MNLRKGGVFKHAGLHHGYNTGFMCVKTDESTGKRVKLKINIL